MIRLSFVCAAAGIAGITACVARSSSAPGRQAGPPSSSAVLAQLPDGEFKRQFIIDCTNCHQFDATLAYPGRQPRTQEAWASIVTRMMQFAGAQTGFPIMSASLHADSTAAWLHRHLRRPPAQESPFDRRIGVVRSADVREFLMPNEKDLPHDVAVDSAGRVLVTGMFTSTMWLLDTLTGQFTAIGIPVANANPRAVEIAANGDWWVLLGGPNKLARFSPQTSSWVTYDIGVYAHSVALQPGKAWFNGHFTRKPERIGYVDAVTGSVTTFDAPPHPTLSDRPGGPIPYELRVDRHGRVWMSELQGHRVLMFDPSASSWRTFTLPVAVSGPRRFDVDRDDVLWVPTYAAGSLVRFDAATGHVREFPLPRKDAAPYVARRQGQTVWVATNASDEVYAFDVRDERFTVYRLPSRGAVVRHLVVDPRNGDVWLAYGASPGIPARIARLRPLN